jgi:hypothetical protein
MKNLGLNMKIHKKLMQARIELQRKELNKSGHNKFANYKYFELSDFLNEIQQIFNNFNLCSVVSFSKEYATLTIFDCDSDESIVFTSPMADANLKGTHPIQNLGAVETYSRRYLYVTALEIVEHDALDATTGSEAPKSAKPITKDVFDGLSAEEQEMVNSFAMNAVLMLNKNDVAGAVEYINSLELDADWKTALWSQFDSKQRSAIKKFTS